MLQSIIKFKTRLALPQNLEFKLHFAKEITNPKIQNRFNKNWKGEPILELYHSSKYGKTAVNSIVKNGFKIYDQFPGNKGRGVYFANHSRYSIWAGKPYHSIICHVIADPNYLNRYHSEIRSVDWNSEFLCNNTGIILPKYLVCFSLEKVGMNEIWDDFGYVEAKEVGCNNKDCLKRRVCNCVQHPLVQTFDVINVNDS